MSCRGVEASSDVIVTSAGRKGEVRVNATGSHFVTENESLAYGRPSVVPPTLFATVSMLFVSNEM